VARARPDQQRHLAAGVPDAPARRGGRRRVATLEQSTVARVDQDSGTTVGRFKDVHDAAGSWSRVDHIIARIEAGPHGCDTRFPPRSADPVSFRDRMKGLLAFRRHHLTCGSGKALDNKLYYARPLRGLLAAFLHQGGLRPFSDGYRQREDGSQVAGAAGEARPYRVVAAG
jgi:hypothetical protein